MFFHRKPRKEEDEPQPIQLPPVVIKGARATALNALLQGRPFLIIFDENGETVMLTDEIGERRIYDGIRLLVKYDKQALETLTDLVIDLNRQSKKSNAD